MENRWWEFYFIRYFVGSVLGSLIIMALAFHPDSSLSSVIAKVFNLHDNNLLVLKSEHFLVVLSFGIAFCYLASAPILVMHALRAHFDFQRNPITSIKFWFIVLAIIIVVSLFLFMWFILSWKPTKIIFFSAYILTVFFQFALLAPAVHEKFNTVFDFYKKLSKDRAKESQDRKQFIESYKHLREHGNAFLILFCELVLGCALFVSTSLSGALAVIIIWLLPTLPIWFLGTFLESKVKHI